jgi:uncharacterized protein YbjT (DUF2867 family)
MTARKTILITGATGKQGGSLIRALEGSDFSLRAMTRKPESAPARQLAGQGVEVVAGDLNDEASLERALQGAWATFAVQNTWEAGVVVEEEQGKRFANVARRVGTQHFVYSSVGSAHRQTGIPHFDNKWRIEETVRGLGFSSYTIFRPVFFMENLTSPWFLNGDKIYSALDPKTVLQMIATEDIGRFVARAFIAPERFNRREIDLAGDEATMPETAATLSKALGRSIDYVRIPIEEVRKNSEDLAIMLEWFDRVGYNADIKALEKEFRFKPLTLAQWAASQTIPA